MIFFNGYVQVSIYNWAFDRRVLQMGNSFYIIELSREISNTVPV